jgi:hypothetical protein
VHKKEPRKTSGAIFLLWAVTERFDATLILLKRTFKWNSNLLYLPRLINRGKPAMVAMPNNVTAPIEACNPYDMELYRFARKLLEEQIAAEGPEFQRDLNFFQKENAAHMPMYREQITRQAVLEKIKIVARSCYID